MISSYKKLNRKQPVKLLITELFFFEKSDLSFLKSSFLKAFQNIHTAAIPTCERVAEIVAYYQSEMKDDLNFRSENLSYLQRGYDLPVLIKRFICTDHVIQLNCKSSFVIHILLVLKL